MLAFSAQRSLELMGREQARLCERLLALTEAELLSPSNLPGWSIADLLVHTTRVCDSLLMAVKRATIGDRTPVFGPTSVAREDEIRAMGPAGWVALQRSAHADLTQVVDGLSPGEIAESTFPFGPGERNIDWFCTQNFAEVAYHRWDLDWSLGEEEPLEDEFAAYLLPFLLDPPRLLFWRKRTDGDPQTFALTTGAETWVLRVTGDGTTVEPSGSAAQITIAAPAGWLALAAYGRIHPTGPAFHVTGPRDAGDRFAAIFGPRS